MKAISKIITGSVAALVLTSEILATPASAAGAFIKKDMSASQMNAASRASAEGACSYFLGCPDSLLPVAHAMSAAKGWRH